MRSLSQLGVETSRILAEDASRAALHCASSPRGFYDVSEGIVWHQDRAGHTWASKGQHDNDNRSNAALAQFLVGGPRS